MKRGKTRNTQLFPPHDLLRGFPPVTHPDIHTLILGSMPGKDSLRAHQYYAHYRNAFWPIMAEIIGFSSSLDYSARLHHLKQAGFALWDVILQCRRRTSLDSAIVEDSIIINDFRSFFRNHRTLKRIVFTGAKAEQTFTKYVKKRIPIDGIATTRLPSTSPANARFSFDKKLATWKEALMDS